METSRVTFPAEGIFRRRVADGPAFAHVASAWQALPVLRCRPADPTPLDAFPLTRASRFGGQVGVAGPTLSKLIRNSNIASGHSQCCGSLQMAVGRKFLSTSQDLARLLSSLLRPGFLSPATLEGMFTPQRLANDEVTDVGIEWRIDKDKLGRRRIHHGATIEGGGAMVLALADEDVTVAVITNRCRSNEADATQIASWFADAPRSETPGALVPIPVDA